MAYRTPTIPIKNTQNATALGPQAISDVGNLAVDIMSLAARTRYEFDVETARLSRAEAEVLFGELSYHYRKGLPFWFSGTDEADIQNAILVDIGDNATTQHLLPNDNITAASETLYLDAVAKTDPTHYSLNDTTGMITWVLAPGTDVEITAIYQCKFLVYISDPGDLFKKKRDFKNNYTFTFKLREKYNG